MPLQTITEPPLNRSCSATQQFLNLLSSVSKIVCAHHENLSRILIDLLTDRVEYGVHPAGIAYGGKPKMTIAVVCSQLRTYN